MSLIELHVHIHGTLDASALQPVIQRLESLMTTQAELAQKLDALSATADQIKTETQASLVEIQTLRDLLAGAGNLSPEAEASLQRLTDKLTGIDGLIPDAPAPAPAPEASGG